MRRVLKWVWAPAILAAALVFVPSGEAKAQSFSYFYGSPRVSFGFSSGYGYGPPVYGVPYGGYYSRRVYAPYPPPYCGPRPYYGGYGHHHHGHHGHHGW